MQKRETVILVTYAFHESALAVQWLAFTYTTLNVLDSNPGRHIRFTENGIL